MWLNDLSYDIDWQDEWLLMWNISEQISEIYKEEIKKSSSWIQRTRKDEKKAKKQDVLLANFLVKILLDKKYDIVLEVLFKAMDSWVPSNLILWILSLIYIEISNHLRDTLGKEKIKYDFYSESTLKFSDNDIPDEIKNRINSWVDDIIDIVTLNPSTIYTNKIINSIKHSKELYTFWVDVFIYFLAESNVYISKEKALDYIEFIFKKLVLERLTSEDFYSKLEEI